VAKKYAQLSIDVTTALLGAGGVVDVTARVKRFVKKAFGSGRRRHFVALWMPGDVLDAEGGTNRTADLRVFLSPENVSVGDRIVLVATVDGVPEPAADQVHREAEDEEADKGWATLYDGAALFVLHVLDRADPLTRDRLSGLDPPRDTAEVVDPEERYQWSKLRDEIVTVLVEQEIRGPASIQALSEHLAGEGLDLELLNDAEEPVSAVDVLSDVLDARKAPRGRGRGRVAEGPFPPQTLPFRAYDPSADAQSLLRLLERAGETFGSATTAPDADAVSRTLREIASGAQPTRGLPR
jgi:hypothetical protein